MSFRGKVGTLGSAVVLIAYFVLLLTNTYFFASGPDSSGYMNGAKLLLTGEAHVRVEALRTFGLTDDMTHVFVPYGFAIHRPGVLVPSYPAGLPLHLAAAAGIGGWKTAPFVLAPIVAIGCLLMCYALGREAGLVGLWAVAPSLMLASFPVFIEHALQPASDNLAMLYALVSFYAALRAHRSAASWAVLAGVAFAMGVWVRPTNILLVVPLAVALRFRPALLLRTAAGALPIGLVIASMNQWLYGKWWRTGYGSFFGVISRTPVCARFHVEWMARILTPVVLPGGLLVVFDRRSSGWIRAMLVSWFGVLFAFYSFYNYCDQPFSIRFLLPAVPALLIGASLVVQGVVDRTAALARGTPVRTPAPHWTPVLQWIGAALLISVSLFHVYLMRTRYDVFHGDEIESIYPETIAWTERQIPSNGILLAGIMTGAYRYYVPSRVTVRWDQLYGDRQAKLESSGAGALPWFALLSDVECSAEELARRVPGEWRVVGRNRDVTLYLRAGT